MPLQGLWWLVCCRQGFSLLARDHGEKEEEESFELRNQDEHTHTGREPPVQHGTFLQGCAKALKHDATEWHRLRHTLTHTLRSASL
ncbi:Pleckstrin homology domain-containing family H member 3 [Anabarilius grahami]|uniref:Pleckstrin homology domain-containing family H member 3 n=1 Tax=Anabarilius grahami TaxID=495550 RepID=A0A3N0YUL9_ANAGA|nr:Pleckstrin homology domain-containing family H member 3 [Anabarilius grahami]